MAAPRAVRVVLVGITVGALLESVPARACAEDVVLWGLHDVDGETVDAVVRERMQREHVPGATVAVCHRGIPRYVGTYGLASLELDAPVTERSVFDLGSLTTTFTAALVQLLVEDGALRLSDELVTYVDDPPDAWRGITIADLLSHTSGLAARLETTSGVSGSGTVPVERLLEEARRTPRVGVPGERVVYSEIGYLLLGVVIERVTGRAFADVLGQRILEPLRLHETTVGDPERIVPGRVQTYHWNGTAFVNAPRARGMGLPSHGGLVSTLADLVRWERELVERNVLPARVVDGLFEGLHVVRDDDDYVAVASGWWRTGSLASHAPTPGAQHVRDLFEEVSVIVLSNRVSRTGDESGGAAAIANAVLARLRVQ